MPNSIDAPGESAVDRFEYENRKDGGIELRDLWDVKFYVLIGAVLLSVIFYIMSAGVESGESVPIAQRVLFALSALLGGFPWIMDAVDKIHPSARSLEAIDAEIAYRSGVSRIAVPSVIALWGAVWLMTLLAGSLWPLSLLDVGRIVAAVAGVIVLDRILEVL